MRDCGTECQPRRVLSLQIGITTEMPSLFHIAAEPNVFDDDGDRKPRPIYDRQSSVPLHTQPALLQCPICLLTATDTCGLDLERPDRDIPRHQRLLHVPWSSPDSGLNSPETSSGWVINEMQDAAHN